MNVYPGSVISVISALFFIFQAGFCEKQYISRLIQHIFLNSSGLVAYWLCIKQHARFPCLFAALYSFDIHKVHMIDTGSMITKFKSYFDAFALAFDALLIILQAYISVGDSSWYTTENTDQQFRAFYRWIVTHHRCNQALLVFLLKFETIS